MNRQQKNKLEPDKAETFAYNYAIERIEALLDMPEEPEFTVMVMAAEYYEDKYFPIHLAIHKRIWYTIKDLIKLLFQKKGI